MKEKLLNKITLLLSIIILTISCHKEREIKHVNNDTFIIEVGQFYFRNNLIEVKEFKNETLVVGLKKHNKTYYSQNVFTAFNKFQKWFIFIDDKDCIWIYNSDYQKLIFLEKIEDSYFENNSFDKKIIPSKVIERM